VLGWGVRFIAVVFLLRPENSLETVWHHLCSVVSTREINPMKETAGKNN
jgi:hypothetical protein